MQRLKIVLYVILSTVCLINISGAVVITFDELGGSSALPSYSSDGFTFENTNPKSDAFVVWPKGHKYYNDSPALFSNNNGFTRIFRNSRDTFTIKSMDLDRFFPSGPRNFKFFAYTTFEDDIYDTFEDDTQDPVGTLGYDLNAEGWVTVNFGSSFENIAYLKFGITMYPYFQFDNVVLEPTPTPEPATLLLLGSGLIGLAGFGRKKFINK